MYRPVTGLEMTFSKESISAVVLKLMDLFSANESKLAFDGVAGFWIAAIRRLEVKGTSNTGQKCPVKGNGLYCNISVVIAFPK